MKPYFHYIAISLISILFTNCQSSLERNKDNALLALDKKFPELPIEKGHLKEHYELVRSVQISHPDVIMSLYEPRVLESKQQIIILSNAEDQCYAIAFPSPRYKSYWNYVYDTVEKPAASKNKSFESEINKALSTLKLNTRRDELKVLSELFSSLLVYAYVRRIDTAALNPVKGQFTGYPDTCLSMQAKTYKSVMQGIETDKYWTSMAYRGTDGRIYQLESLESRHSNTPMYYKIEVYRLPCVIDVQSLDM